MLKVLEALPAPDPTKPEEAKIKASAIGGALQRLAHAKFEQASEHPAMAGECLKDLQKAYETDPDQRPHPGGPLGPVLRAIRRTIGMRSFG